MEENLNKKIDQVMNSLDGMEKASPAPFFFTRLEARMQSEKSTWEVISGFVSKPVVAIVCICLVIMINAAVIFSSINTASADRQNNEIATADEYNLLGSTFYEFVNTNP